MTWSSTRFALSLTLSLTLTLTLTKMREKISRIEMELGITPPNTYEPEIYAGPFAEQDEDEGEVRSWHAFCHACRL